MAGLICVAQVTEVAVGGASNLTVLQVAAPANQRLKLKRWGVFFDGTSGNQEPVVVSLKRQTSAGTMSSLTPVKQSAGSETVQSTAAHTATAEPTAGDTIDVAEVHPQSGYEVLIPFDMPIEIPGGGRVGIHCTNPGDAIHATAKLVFEE